MANQQGPEAIREHKDVINMFACVWVKVEVKDGEMEPIWKPAQPLPPTVDQNPFENQRKRKKKRKYTKTLHCDKCEYTTVYKNCLEVHVMGHYNTKPYVCELCSYSTKYPSSLYRHTTIKHHDKVVDNADNGGVLPTLNCDHCQYTTHFKWNLNAHKRKHKLEKQFKCPHCAYETAYRHNFVKHGKVHKDYEAFKCDKCPFVTKFEGHIHRHLAKIHHEVIDKAHVCDLCTFSTKEKWRLNIHKQRSKHENVLKCSYCEFETYYMCESKKHKKIHYSEIYGNGRVLNCSHLSNEVTTMILSKQISQMVNISQITNNANDGTQIEQTDEVSREQVKENAAEVNENVSQAETEHSQTNNYKLDPNCLDWHSIQVLESEDKDRPFQCVMCTYTSKFKASVQRHFQRHHTGTQNRPYKCCNCDFSTKTKDQIALHNKRSQSENPLFCSICGFSTFYKCQFVLHQKCHYTYKCTVCNYSCKHKYELTKHFATLHLGHGLKCQYCDFRAARKESILCHETIHTGVKPFRCDLCEYMSVRKSLLDNHLKRYHSDIQKDVTIVNESKIQTLKISITDEGRDNMDCDMNESQCQNLSIIESHLLNNDME